jgi:hypothetical protein
MEKIHRCKDRDRRKKKKSPVNICVGRMRTRYPSVRGGTKGGRQGPWPLPRLRHRDKKIYKYSLNFVCLNIYTLKFVHHN